MKFLCRIGWHNWTLWSEPRDEQWVRRYHISAETVPYIRSMQTRRCQDCRKQQQREMNG